MGLKKNWVLIKSIWFGVTQPPRKVLKFFLEQEQYHLLSTHWFCQYCLLTGLVKGDYEPTEDECEWPSESEDEDESALAKEVNEKAKLETEEKKTEEKKDVKGVPQFWLTIFKNVEMISDMIQEADEPALETLKDVTLSFSEVWIKFV